MTDQPFYPASWLDADGEPLPDVHEVEPGEWPPCRPEDWIDVLTSKGRDSGTHQEDGSWRARDYQWGLRSPESAIVAIRIIERSKA